MAAMGWNPLWLNIFDHMMNPIPDVPDFFSMGNMSNMGHVGTMGHHSFAAPPKPVDHGAISPMYEYRGHTFDPITTTNTADDTRNDVVELLSDTQTTPPATSAQAVQVPTVVPTVQPVHDHLVSEPPVEISPAETHIDSQVEEQQPRQPRTQTQHEPPQSQWTPIIPEVVHSPPVIITPPAARDVWSSSGRNALRKKKKKHAGHKALVSSKAMQQSVGFSVPGVPSLSSMVINDLDTALVQFYFKETAQLFSCYDSRMNPFRTAVVRMWTSSRIIYCTLQSMAAASLLNEFPHVAPIGKQLRQEAIQLLYKSNNTWDLNSMLAILMLGATSSWHDTSDLGLTYFNQIAERLATSPVSAFGDDEDHHNYRFFHESMLYWEMLLAFVTDSDGLAHVTDSGLPSEGIYVPQTTASAPVLEEGNSQQQQHQQQPHHPRPERPPPRRVPHPWTGFACETQRAVQRVGRLVRRQRKYDYAHRFASLAHINQLKKDMATARELEDYLVNIAHPSEQSVKDTEDNKTPVWHLLTLAEVIRATGLIQLYHVFPDLLGARLRRERAEAAKAGPGVDGDEDEDDEDGSDSGSEDSEDDDSEDSDITPQERSKWLALYALRTLDMMKAIPLESGTRDFQPFLLVALCSELRASHCEPESSGDDSNNNNNSSGTNNTNSDDCSPLQSVLHVNMEAVEVMRARGFIQSRLTSFLHVLPPKPVMVCLNIVKETWRQMDQQAEARAKHGKDVEGEADVYWMDVMIEKGWETTMA